MTVSNELQSLIELAEPLWAGEGEVVRTYFTWSGRTRQTDLLWLRRQCKKELWDSIHLMDTDKGMFLGPLEMLRDAFPKIETGIDRHEILEMTETLHEEFAHYVAFADAYDAIRMPGDPTLDPKAMRADDEWPENLALGELRAGHRRDHGAIGARACKFTEGGYCGLFREGMNLKGDTPADAAIAAACKLVYDDEFGHMLKGIVGLDDGQTPAADWKLLGELVTAQMRARIRMRNAQFGNPLSEARLEEIFAGKVDPLRFDYERAQLAA
jgi:hypothetical protein